MIYLDTSALVKLVHSPDAIHLATALELATDLTALVAYDKRLGEAATAAGLPWRPLARAGRGVPRRPPDPAGPGDQRGLGAGDRAAGFGLVDVAALPVLHDDPPAMSTATGSAKEAVRGSATMQAAANAAARTEWLGGDQSPTSGQASTVSKQQPSGGDRGRRHAEHARVVHRTGDGEVEVSTTFGPPVASAGNDACRYALLTRFLGKLIEVPKSSGVEVR